MTLLTIAGVTLLYLSLFTIYQPTFLSHSLIIISDHGDSLLNYRMLSHGLKALGSLSWHDFWGGNIFYPFDTTMSLSDTLLYQVLAVCPWV